MGLIETASKANLKVVPLGSKGWFVHEDYASTGVFAANATELDQLIVAYQSARNVTVDTLVEFAGRRGFRIFYPNKNPRAAENEEDNTSSKRRKKRNRHNNTDSQPKTND